MSDRCKTCGGAHTTEVATARCAYSAALRDHVRSEAAVLDKAPTVAQVDDLWSHARDMSDDGEQAMRWALKVLWLGWRPVVGGYR